MSGLDFVKIKDYEDVKDESKYLDRTKDKGLLNENGAGFAVDDDGNVSIASSDYSQYKLDANGVSSEVTLQSNTITNTKNLRVDNLAINRHRMNPALWELTDFKKINGTNAKVVGNLTMTGTVLVKAWEPTLKKHVLIRRPVRMPIFSTTLNVPDVPDLLSVSSGIGKDLAEYLLKVKNEQQDIQENIDKKQNKEE